jgi:hypothetical protein
MSEQHKNPYRRTPAPDTERRPGLRRLPADLEDLATGKAERVARPRRAPNPMLDEREGAVIPGVRNSEARTVYDARVAGLRTTLSAGDDGALRAALEAVRRLALWRARNVTDYSVFMEHVVGVGPELAQALSEQAPTAAALPDHVIALALRVEAALVARLPGVPVRVIEDAAGVRLAIELPVDDVERAVEALSDVGEAAVGLRRFLRGPERAGYGAARAGAAVADSGEGQASSGDERPARSPGRDVGEERFQGRRRDGGFKARDDRGFNAGGGDRPFEGPSDDHAFKGPRDDRPFKGPRDDRAFNGPRDDQPFKGPRDDRAFNGPRNDRPFKGPRDDRAFNGPRNDRPFKGPRDDRAFNGPRNDRPFKGPRDDRAFKGPTDDRPVKGPRDDRAFKGGDDRRPPPRRDADTRGFKGKRSDASGFKRGGGGPGPKRGGGPGPKRGPQKPFRKHDRAQRQP